MKKCIWMIALAALAAGSAWAQEGEYGRPHPQGGKPWNDEAGRKPGWGQMEKRGGQDHPGGPMDPEMMERMRAEHRAIKALGEAARLESDPAKQAVLVEQLRGKLNETADLMQANQERRLAQAEERLAGLKEKIEYAKANRDRLIEEQIQRILSGEPPQRPAAFDQFPYAKGGRPPPPPPGAEMEDDLPPPEE